MHFSTVQSHTTAGRYGFMIDRGLSIDPSLRLDSTLPSEESQTRQLRVGRAKKKGEGKEFPQTSRSSSSTTTHQGAKTQKQKPSPMGVEPMTSRLTAARSDQLS